jgi:hypothetical protein
MEPATRHAKIYRMSHKFSIIDPFFFNEHVNGDAYLRILEEEVSASVLNEDGEFPTWFQQDGAPAH